MTSMRHPRRFHAMTVLHDSIFVFGGRGVDTLLDSVEKYDVELNEWSFVASLLSARSYCAAVTLNSQCYLLGGENTAWKCLDTIDCYDPDSDNWSVSRPLGCPRSFVGAVANHRFLFYIIFHVRPCPQSMIVASSLSAATTESMVLCGHQSAGLLMWMARR